LFENLFFFHTLLWGNDFLMLRSISCMEQRDGSCFYIHVSLCLFIGELSPLILRDINSQWLLISVILVVVVMVAVWVCVCVCVCVSFFWCEIISFPCFLVLTSLCWSFPSSTCCMIRYLYKLFKFHFIMEYFLHLWRLKVLLVIVI
jgi:hypothetical protein